MTATLFGIPITDRASRLVAADYAEEYDQADLAAALRDTRRAVVLVNTKPLPTLLPDVSHWRAHARRPDNPNLRAARGLLDQLMHRAGYTEVTLSIVHDPYGCCRDDDDDDSPAGWLRWHLDPFQSGEVFENAPTTRDEFRVVPGVVLVRLRADDLSLRRRRRSPDPVLYFHPADAPRFGFGYVPAFSEVEGKSP